MAADDDIRELRRELYDGDKSLWKVVQGTRDDVAEIKAAVARLEERSKADRGESSTASLTSGAASGAAVIGLIEALKHYFGTK